MLRVIAKFDDVEMAVVALQQMRLRAAAHLPDQACGFDQHQECKGSFYGSWHLAFGRRLLDHYQFARPIQRRTMTDA